MHTILGDMHSDLSLHFTQAWVNSSDTLVSIDFCFEKKDEEENEGGKDKDGDCWLPTRKVFFFFN